MVKLKTKKDYNYKQITVTFDLDTPEEKKLYEYLEANKRKKNGYGAQIKAALRNLIKGRDNGCAELNNT